MAEIRTTQEIVEVAVLYIDIKVSITQEVIEVAVNANIIMTYEGPKAQIMV